MLYSQSNVCRGRHGDLQRYVHVQFNSSLHPFVSRFGLLVHLGRMHGTVQ